MRPSDREILSKLLQEYVPDKSSRILDFGCGLGGNLDFLKSMGYTNITGTDISAHMIDATRKAGHPAFSAAELPTEPGFNVILMSHVIEHIPFEELQKTMESVLSRLTGSKGQLIVLTPILYDAFFNDIDHIKPYYPDGLTRLFSDQAASKQYKSDWKIQLLDIHFRKDPLLPYNLRCKYKTDLINKITFRGLTLTFRLLQIVSLNILSKATGYGAVFHAQKSS